MGKVVYERFVTVQDERTCVICRPLNGQIFVRGFGPQPPMHPNCRCRREEYISVIIPGPGTDPDPEEKRPRREQPGGGGEE